MELETGFYYHYKHDPAGVINNYAYEVLHVARHSEIEDIPGGLLVIYRPIRPSEYYQDGKYWAARPYSMFVENVTKDGKTFPRFTKITDPEVVAGLEKIRDALYP